MPNLPKPPESSNDKMVANKTPKVNSKQSDKNKETLLTQDINMEFEAIGSPLPDPSVTQNHSSHFTQLEEHYATEK